MVNSILIVSKSSLQTMMGRPKTYAQCTDLDPFCHMNVNRIRGTLLIQITASICIQPYQLVSFILAARWLVFSVCFGSDRLSSDALAQNRQNFTKIVIYIFCQILAIKYKNSSKLPGKLLDVDGV